MKKLFCFLLSTALAVPVCGCTRQTQSSAVRKVNDGTYQGEAEGWNGNITVSVTFSNHEMTDVTIDDENESSVYADAALKDIPEYIKKEQSIDVDVSTGATVTSNAVMEAAGKAVEKAGGIKEDWSTDTSGKHVTRKEKMSADAVVVGGGPAGIAAVLRLEQLGVNTLLIEKNGSTGGSFEITDVQTQLASGLEEDNSGEDAVQSEEMNSVFDDLYAYGGQKGNQDLLHLLCNGLADTTDWQQRDLGMTFKQQTPAPGYQGNIISSYDNTDGSVSRLLNKELDVCGAKILTKTALLSLNHDSSGISGITAKSSGGTIYDIDARYIILACGSNGAALTDQLPYYGNFMDTGDWNVLALTDSDLVTAEGNPVKKYTGMKLSAADAIDMWPLLQSFSDEKIILLNKEGNPVEMNSGSSEELSDRIAAQTDSTAYFLMDRSTWRKILRILNGNGAVIADIIDSFSGDDAENPFYFKTIEDACMHFGIDPDKAVQSAAEKAVDDEITIDGDNGVYAIPCSAFQTGSLSGIVTDSQLHVMSDGGNAVENVYAAGSAVAGVFGDQVPAGAMNAWSFVSGKYCADTVYTALTAKQ